MDFVKNKGAIILLGVALLVGGFFVYTVTQRTLTGLESVCLQFFILASGLLGSFIFGRQSAEKHAKEMVKPVARSAFRRLVSLYFGLSRIATIIANTSDSETENKITFAKIEGIVISQIATADDALKDWEDIVPEDIEGLKKDFLKENHQLEEIR